MTGLTWGEKPLNFIHIAKTGGTSIEDWGRDNNYLWSRFDDAVKRNNHYPFIFRDAAFQSKYDWFVVVRNPFARIVSMFYHAHNDLYVKNSSPYTPINKTQADMNEWIQQKIETRLHPPVSWHWGDQYLYVSNKKQCQCNMTIIYYENMLPEFRTLMRDESLILPESNYHRAKKLSIRNITQETARMIYASYYQDFRLFGYQRELRGAVPPQPPKPHLRKKRLTQENVPTWSVASEKYRLGVPS
jgi:hypothetical protein